MRDNDLKARQRRRFKKTTDSNHGGPVAPNHLDQDFAATAPDQKWAADISYIWTTEGWLYLGLTLTTIDRLVDWRRKASRSGLTRTPIDRDPCLSPDLSAARKRLAVRFCLADACDPRRA